MSFFSELKQAGKRSLPDRKTGSEKAVFFIAFTLLALYCLSLIYPFFWMFLNSLKGSLEYSGGNTFALPEKWLFSNYAQAFTMLKLDNGITFFDMIFNSVWYTVLGAGLGVFASSITGYCLSKYKFKGRNLIYSIAIFAMTIPIVGTAAASFKFTREIGIYDTPLYVVATSFSGWGFNFLVLYGSFKNLSWDYAEAVFIDGGSHFVAFFKVMLPMVTGPIATLFIIAAIGRWNDYMTVIMYLPSYHTIASGLYVFKSLAIRGVNYPVYYAGLMLSMIPIIVLFVFCADIMLANLSTGGLKG